MIETQLAYLGSRVYNPGRSELHGYIYCQGSRRAASGHLDAQAWQASLKELRKGADKFWSNLGASQAGDGVKAPPIQLTCANCSSAKSPLHLFVRANLRS